MPRAFALRHFASRGVEGEGSGAEVGDRPCPFGLEQQHQMSEIVGRVRGARGQPPRHVIELGQQTAALLAVLGVAGAPPVTKPDN
jgi:hypothetical protein